MPRTRSLCLMIGVIASSSGCHFDLTEVQFAPQPPSLSVRIAFDEAAGAVEVVVGFYPGTTANGWPSALPDDSIRLNGTGIAPAEIRSNGMRWYRITGLRPSDPPPRLRAPVIPHLSSPPPQVDIRPLRLQVPDTLRTAPSGSFELTITGTGEDPAEQGSWSLRVRPGSCSDRDVLWLTAPTAPSASLHFPTDLLPNELKSGFLQYSGTASHRRSGDAGGYEVLVIRSLEACVPFRR